MIFFTNFSPPRPPSPECDSPFYKSLFGLSSLPGDIKEELLEEEKRNAEKFLKEEEEKAKQQFLAEARRKQWPHLYNLKKSKEKKIGKT